MSVDNTISELSNTLSELGRLVNHINSQIAGITGRINVTLDNFDSSVAKVATDAAAVTGQVGDSVSQVPNSWVFYMLFITLIIVFILLSIVLFLNLITKIHAIYVIVRGKDTEKVPILDESQSTFPDAATPPEKPHPLNPQYGNTGTFPMTNKRDGYRRAEPVIFNPQQPMHQQVVIPMEYEPPRRYGDGGGGARIADNNGFTPDAATPRPYQRKMEDRGGAYNLETGQTSSFPRSLRSQEV